MNTAKRRKTQTNDRVGKSSCDVSTTTSTNCSSRKTGCNSTSNKNNDSNHVVDDKAYEVEKVLSKKIYQGKVYYKLKWVGSAEPTWELEENCSCDNLIQKYEKLINKQSLDEEEDEWEVEEIVGKRTRKGVVEYLVKWKSWPGEPTWVREDDCGCMNLIAAYENPKLRKLWNFTGHNVKLWLDGDSMLKYMSKYARRKGYRVNLLKFEKDFPQNERPLKLEDGLNIGPLCYENHWYLVIILVNHICVTRKLLVGDPLNTLIGVSNTRVHPVIKRLNLIYPKISRKPIAITPMDRSDVCAFYVLAAFERALFVFQSNAQHVVESLFFDNARPELIRSKIKPESDGEISVSLPIPDSFDHGPKCEFCNKLFDTTLLVDSHITRRHMGTKLGE